jgi:hypothetical protein
MSPTDLSKWALLTEMVQECFLEDVDVSQALILTARNEIL